MYSIADYFSIISQFLLRVINHHSFDIRVGNLPLYEASPYTVCSRANPGAHIFKRNSDATSTDTVALKDGQELRKGQTNGNVGLKLNFVIQVLSRVI